MKRMVLVFLLVLFWMAELAATETVKEFPAATLKKLAVDLQCGGAIEVSGAAAGKVRVQVIFNETSEKEWDIAYTSEGDVLTVECQARQNDPRSPRFRIQVPRKLDLELKTRGGDITVTEVSGTITGRTQGGDLHLSKLQGTVQMKTMGGEIDLRDSQIDGEVVTMGGRVSIEDVVGNIKGRSMGGNVVYRNVRRREGDGDGKVVRIHTMGGSIHVDQAECGAEVETMGGDITIQSASEYVKAKTMGGNIVIRAIDGRVRATTMGGDIEARITGGSQKSKDANLTSYSGGITLEVPEALAMEINIQLAYTEGNQGEYHIHSDFPLQIEEDKEWSQEHGTPRKTIRARGKTGDGRNKIAISTINGDVYLKKGK